MEKLPIYLLMLIVYLIAASGGKKKKRQQGEAAAAAKPGRNAEKNAERKRARSERKEERARRERTAQTEKGFAAAFAPERASKASAAASGQAGEADRLAGIPEGEDICHPEREEKKPSRTEWLDMDQARTAGDAPAQERNALGEDVLRGIIMSEILTRPCERRARNRQGYHG